MKIKKSTLTLKIIGFIFLLSAINNFSFCITENTSSNTQSSTASSSNTSSTSSFPSSNSSNNSSTKSSSTPSVSGSSSKTSLPSINFRSQNSSSSSSTQSSAPLSTPDKQSSPAALLKNESSSTIEKTTASSSLSPIETSTPSTNKKTDTNLTLSSSSTLREGPTPFLFDPADEVPSQQGEKRVLPPDLPEVDSSEIKLPEIVVKEESTDKKNLFLGILGWALIIIGIGIVFFIIIGARKSGDVALDNPMVRKKKKKKNNRLLSDHYYGDKK